MLPNTIQQAPNSGAITEPQGWQRSDVESDAANGDGCQPRVHHDDDAPPDNVLARACPQCHLPAEWPDCVACEYNFDEQRNRPTANDNLADRLALTVPDDIRSLKSWLLWKRVPESGKKDRKVPVYVNGGHRQGTQGSEDDRAALATFDEALAALRRDPRYAGIGLAMLPENNLVALDFDNCIDDAGRVAADVQYLVDSTYAETSPSGRGVRALLRGLMDDRKHEAGKAEGIEVFHRKGFVTITGEVFGAGEDIADLCDARKTAIVARLGGAQANDASFVPAAANDALPPQTVTELRSALNAISSEAYDDWLYVGMCLRQYGNQGRELWMSWSQTSEKFNLAAAARKWNALPTESKHGYTGIFAKAQKAGWVNPLSKAAQLSGTPAAWTPTAPGFRFVPASDLLVPVAVEWLIRGYIETNTSSLLFGAPAAGKSFLALDWACCIATGRPWCGHAVRRGSVFVIAGEGHVGIGRRLSAWARHHGSDLTNVPLFVSKASAALANTKSAEAVSRAVQALVADRGKPSLIVVDTLARNFGEGDESSAEDIGKYVANLDRLREWLDCAILTVHHSGHSEQQRARGSSALRAAVDHEFSLTCEQAGARTLTCSKAKDSEPPAALALSLKVVELPDWPQDEDRVQSSCVLVQDGDAAPKAKAKVHPLTGANRIALDQLRRTLKESGEPPNEAIRAEFPGDLHTPAKVISENRWRERCYSAGIAEGTESAKRKAFARAKEKLLDLGHVCLWDGYCWVPMVA